MILKVVGQVKGHREKMTMTLDTETFRQSHLEDKTLTEKKMRANAKRTLTKGNTKKWEDFKEFFEKKAEVQNNIANVLGKHEFAENN